MMVSQNSNLTLRSIPTSKVDQTLQAFFPSEGCVCVCVPISAMNILSVTTWD